MYQCRHANVIWFRLEWPLIIREGKHPGLHAGLRLAARDD